jgi:hypothetical protein
MINHKLGPYRILEQVGEGGMGAVYRATDEMLGRDVAIKVLRPSLAHDAALVDRFRHEARSLARVSHPNVAALYGLFEEQGTLFMAMEFVNGETADGMLRRRRRLPWAEAGAVMLDVLNGLEGAHRLGIIHRDLKPANLLVASSGAVKITDFGIARVLGSARYTRTGAVVGTLAYMAPEQVRGEEGDARTDVYAAGMVLYELLTGAVAFQRTSEYDMMRAVVEDQARPPREALPDAPEWLDAVVLKALSKDPSDRFQSAAEMLSALQADLPAAEPALAGTTRVAAAGAFVPLTRLALAPSATKIAAPVEASRTRRRRVAIAAATMLCMSLTAGWAAWGSSPDSPRPQPPRTPAASVPTQPMAAPLNPPDMPVLPPAAPSPEPDEPRRPSKKPAAPKPVEQEPAPPIAAPVEAPPAGIEPPEPPAPVSRNAEPEVSLGDVEFEDVKMLRTAGGKTEEVDVRLTFARNRIVVTMRKETGMSQSMPYRSVTSAVYSQSKHPRWKEGSAAALAVGVFAAPVFFMKGTRHWLTLEGGGDAIVLRLDKKNYQAILPELEVRTGRRVERARSQE